MKIRCFPIICTALMLFGWPWMQAQDRYEAVVIQGGTLIDGTGAPPRKIAALVISGNRIQQIVPEGATFQSPAGARTVRADGMSILPGLIDSHVHYQGFDAELYISHGVTSVLDLGNVADWILAQREGTATGQIYGPRIFTGGRGFGGGVYGIHLGMAPIKDVEDGMRQAREAIALGVDAVKVHDGITPLQLKAVVAEAHKAGLPVIGHLGATDARQAAEAGIDVEAHLSGVLTALAPDAVGEKLRNGVGGDHFNHFETDYALKIDFEPDPKRMNDLAKLLVEKHVKLEPDIVNRTKGLYPQWPQFEDENFKFLKDPALLVYIPRGARERWLYETRMTDPLLWPVAADYISSAESRAKVEALQRRNYGVLVEFMKKFVAAGGEIVLGTDAQHRAVPGLAYSQELQLLVENVGITPMQTIVSATRNPARMLHKEKDLGTVEAGKLADIILVKGDPLQDIRTIRNVETVIKDGKIMQTGYHAWYSNPLPRPTLPGPANGENPIPIITSVTPPIATQGEQEAIVTIKGSKFAVGCFVTVDGRAVPLLSGSPEELRVKLGKTDLAKVGTLPVVVTNPPPYGGPSSPNFFMVKFRVNGGNQ